MCGAKGWFGILISALSFSARGAARITSNQSMSHSISHSAAIFLFLFGTALAFEDIPYDGFSLFHVTQQHMNYEKAAAHCQSLGLALAEIHNGQELG